MSSLGFSFSGSAVLGAVSERLADALAGIYSGVMLPSVIARTKAKDYADADGFVMQLALRHAF